MRRIAVLSACFVVAGLACSDDDNGAQDAHVGRDAFQDATADVLGRDANGPDAGSAPDIQELVTAYVAGMCRHLAECGGLAVPLGTVLSQQDCEAMMSGFRENMERILSESLGAGRATLDAEAARRCVEAFQSAQECEDLAAASRICGEALDPTLADGQECWMDAECLGGWCQREQGACPGQCVSLPGEGESCQETQRCRRGLVCLRVSGSWVCGAPRAEGESCDGSIDCDIGLYCSGGTCQAQKNQGEACGMSYECRGGLFCRGNTCTPPEVVATEGESCNPFTGVLCDYSARLTCQLDEVTNALTCEPVGREGESCNPDRPACELVSRLYCDQATQTCTAPAPDGTACGSNEECASGYCDPGSGVCAAPECL